MIGVLDTNFYSALDRGIPSAMDAIQIVSQIFLPCVVYGELYYGFSYGQHFQKNLRRLHSFIKQFEVHFIPVDPEIAKLYGQTSTSLRRKGTPIPTNDIWIAACSLSVAGTLLTADKHFLEIDSLQVNLIPV